MNECKIVEDLLPLYAEELVSPETKEFVDVHCACCESCDKLKIRAMQPAEEKTVDAKAYRKALRRDSLIRSMKGAAVMVLVFAIIGGILIAGDGGTEPWKQFASPDGIHSVSFQRFNGVYGIGGGHGLEQTWRNGKSRHSSSFSDWQDLQSVDWSPNGCNALLTIVMTGGREEMMLWLHEYTEDLNRSFQYPSPEKGKMRFLDDILLTLCREHGDLPEDWETISFAFQSWQTDEDLCLTYALDGGEGGRGSLIFHYPTESIQIIPDK